MHKLNIGIAGAGIGGLAAASLLADQGHTITIIDQFGTPDHVGSGLVIQPVGQAVLAQIGALDLAMSRGNKILHMLGHEANNGRRVLDVGMIDRPIIPNALVSLFIGPAFLMRFTKRPCHATSRWCLQQS